MRGADALVFGSPGYHGTLSGLVKNALDYLEELGRDARPYVDGLPVACVVTASGWQAAVNTLRSLRETVHALRGWPTPLGLAVNVADGLFDEQGRFRDDRLPEQIRGVATQLVTFARANAQDREMDAVAGTETAVGLVTDQVRRAIALGRYAPGDRLPAANDVAAQLGVTPETARRALEGLVADGIVVLGGDRGDRPTVAAGVRADDAAGRTAGLAAFREILDYRSANECAAARLAAQRHDDADLEAIHDALQRLHRAARTPGPGAVGRFHRADTDFHVAVARAARNGLIERAVADARARMFLPVGGVFSRLREGADDLHDAIAAAIEAGDGEAAAAAMAAHIEATRAEVESALDPATRAVLA